MSHTTVIYEGTPGRRLQTAHLEVVGIADDDGLDDALERAIAGGADRIELCGGMGAAHLARARELAAGRAPVGLLRYAFESLELIALYKQSFAAGTPGPAAFLFPAVDDTEPIEHQDVTILPVYDRDHAERIGARFARDGIGMVELYGGLGPAAATAVLRGAGGAVPVGFVDP